MLARGRGLVEKTLEGGIQRKKLTPAKRDAILSRIAWTKDVGEAVHEARLVIEAVFEEESVKLPLFREVGELAPPDAIVSTNTSSLSVTRLAQGSRTRGGSRAFTSSSRPRSTSCSR